MENFSNVLSATRAHFPADSEGVPEKTQEHLKKYVLASQRLGVKAAIAVNAHATEVQNIAEEAAPGFDVHVLHVPYWGAFVPALNALLSFAQSSQKRYILYQSLEVICSPTVLHWLRDHHTPETLVSGPALPGHCFQPGEQPLNGRSAPWNTLALWSVRKLALTGFLSIADGLQSDTHHNGEQAELSPDSDGAPMGSSDWWSGGDVSTGKSWIRQHSGGVVPAGVEEVTAIALLQDLLGKEQAQAILIDVPHELQKHISWETDWAGDERRKQWHEYKMSTKITRPDEQLQRLFAGRMDSKKTHKGQAEEGLKVRSSKFGVVIHRGPTIRPPRTVENICLASTGLFFLNLASVFPRAFLLLNNSFNTSAFDLIALVLLLGGVFVPMPLSLYLTRQTTVRAGHKAGLVLFVLFIIFSHLAVMVWQLFGTEAHQLVVLLIARLVQGLGSGILFQARYVLASLSTGDQQTDLQAWQFLVGDFGFGFGALLPALTTLTSFLFGSAERFSNIPEVLPAAFMVAVSSTFLAIILVAFPRHLSMLPDRVRFPRHALDIAKVRSRSKVDESGDYYRRIVWVSGTTRVFVQSAVMPIAALAMRDNGYTGKFRQSIVVAALSLLPMPFEAVASSICCYCATRVRARDSKDVGKVISGTIGGLVLFAALAFPHHEGVDATSLASVITELAALMIALAVAAPLNASRLYQLEDAERSTVILVWMQAYFGRLLGPLLAVLLYNTAGYGSVLTMLCAATAVVAYTA